MKHTELPWKYTYDNDTGNNDEGFWEFFTIMTDTTIPGDERIGRTERAGDAEFICRACNGYYDMLEALKYVVRYHREHDSGEGELYGLDYVTTCISAIRKAEERCRCS